MNENDLKFNICSYICFWGTCSNGFAHLAVGMKKSTPLCVAVTVLGGVTGLTDSAHGGWCRVSVSQVHCNHKLP